MRLMPVRGSGQLRTPCLLAASLELGSNPTAGPDFASAVLIVLRQPVPLVP